MHADADKARGGADTCEDFRDHDLKPRTQKKRPPTMTALNNTAMVTVGLPASSERKRPVQTAEEGRIER